jgi:outer membrane usher protein
MPREKPHIRGGIARSLCRALLVVVLLIPAAPARAADTPLQLDVVLNGLAIGKIGEFVQRGARVLAQPAELAALGLRLPPGLPAGADGLVALSDIPQLDVRLDPGTQSIFLAAPAALLAPVRLNEAHAADKDVTVESGTGLVLNYDLAGSLSAGIATGNGLFDLRGFSHFGTVSTGLLAYAGPARGGAANLVRLDSGFAYADPSTLRRFRLGDVISGGLTGTRPVRLGGIQIQSDFSLRPDLVTYPLPMVSGTAAVPSTVDIVINNSRVLSREVPPGPFEAAQLPVVNGASSITTTVTDALGRQRVATMPFYASSDLLARGLESYSIELGWVRQGWGFVSNDYRDLSGMLTWRRGLTDTVTGQFHAEGISGLAMAGVGLAANVFDWGTVDFGVSGSMAGGRAGSQLLIGVQRLGPVFSFGVSALFSDGRFRDVAALYDAPAPQRQITANLGLAMGKYGGLGIAYTGIRRSPLFPPDDRPGGILPVGSLPLALPAERADIVSASYSVQLGRFSLYANGFHDLAAGSGGALFGITLPLGPRSSISASTGMGADGAFGQLHAAQSPVSVGDWGYQAYALSKPQHVFAEGKYKSPWGLASAGLDWQEGMTTLRAGAHGALGAIKGGGVFAGNTIDDSFAIVDTGVPNLVVMGENRVVGRTDSSGRILVPDLRAFDANHISIDPNGVPITDTLESAARTVRPQERSGVVVSFPIRRSNAALLKLTDGAGLPLPLGSVVTLLRNATAVPMGYDGAVYLENLEPEGNRLEVLSPDGKRCAVLFDVPFQDGNVPTIGPFVCREP